MSRDDRKVLRRGLTALMADMGASSPGGSGASSALRTVPIDQLVASPAQPRKEFRKEALDELAESIRQRGMIQPIIVRPVAGTADRFEIVAGERRWRAAGLAGVASVPVIVRDMDDSEMLRVAIVENVQRSDLNPIEEAAGYRSLVERFGHTQEEIAAALGKSRSHIANTLRLLNLPEDVRNQLSAGLLSAGHARALLSAKDPVALGAVVVGKGLTVRQTEDLVRRSVVDRKPRVSHDKDADTRALEGDLSATLKMQVTITHGAAGEGGAVSIRYRSLEDLDFICRVLASADRTSVI